MRFILTIGTLILFFSCSNNSDTLFKLLKPSDCGIKFINSIVENDTLNILKLEYIYNGGSVAIGDFNNDGLSDVYFGGNMVSSELYLNKGNLKFENVTTLAGLNDVSKWRSGVALADVNGDGWLDIYVCTSISKDSVLRANMLYINQGNSPGGIPTFKDEARAYGVADFGHSSNAAFFDYDNDGDLDLYVLTNTIQSGTPTSYRPKVNDGTAINTDRLYRNNGDSTFTNVSKQAGILYEGYGLGLAIADINQDGWQDIYVSNDYISNDLLYINNHDGTFSNRIDEWIKHQSQFSMGNDVADINNDRLPDIITLDMLPEGNLRRKTVIGGTGYISYINNEKYGYSPQYVRNMLQLNNGNGTFSEIGQLAGVHQTEWSWSPLFADFDNDGLKDLIITNGFPRDITDKDFGNYRGGPAGALTSSEMLLDSMPVVKVSNHAFKNINGLTFDDVTEKWGMSIPSFSNGAAFADFDNDGDLDYVVNNINESAFMFENTLYQKEKNKSNQNHFLRLKLHGNKSNLSGFGTKVTLYYDNGKIQYHEHSTSRGYISSVEDVIHFGLGKFNSVDSVLVQWPDGNQQKIMNVKAGQVLYVKYEEDDHSRSNFITTAKTPMVQSFTDRVKFVHLEADKIDFNIQRTLPHKFSQMGPGVSVGDCNGDDLEDFFIGGSVGHNGTFFFQNPDGSFFLQGVLGESSVAKEEEDEGSLFFDSDNDGDLDLYVVSGGFEYEPDNKNYQDRLYLNDGRGNFTFSIGALPEMVSSKSVVRATDFDADGDLDLFVGGRVVPGKYPYSARSYVLKNDNGKFLDVTEKLGFADGMLGMITDALWSDFNNDGKTDLILAGEFMPLTCYMNKDTKFIKLTSTGLDRFTGLWNSLAGGDFDNDGDIDYIGGNLGQNNYYKATHDHPLTIYAKDIDGNNSVDALLTCYFKSEQGEMKEYPLHFWDDLNSQSPKFRRKFSYYRQYGLATIDDVLSEEEKDNSLIMKANHMSSSYIENLGNSNFKLSELPTLVQVAPVNGMLTIDINKDGNLDIVLVGNDYGNEVFAGRYDAFTGIVLHGNGKGDFTVVSSVKSGFCVNGDGKALSRLSGVKGDIIIATQNRDSIRMFIPSISVQEIEFKPERLDIAAEIIYTDGRKQRVEFYYGSGYLSQSSRRLKLTKNIREIIVYNSKGESRKVLVKGI